MYHLIFVVKIKNIMKVCVIGSGLTSLTLAKTLVNQGIYVDVFSNFKTKKLDKSRTLSISKSNIHFYNSNVLNIERLLWKINKIEIYNKFHQNEKILNFNDKNQLFSVVKNFKLYNLIISNLKKSSLFKIKKIQNNEKFLKKNYKLIINCDFDNYFTKKYFYKKINKNYKSQAYTTIIKHKKLINNDVATQIFTEKGPIAFLPISNKETSIVYSVKGKDNIDLKKYIKIYNSKYSILEIGKISKFGLKSSQLRSYYYDNILAFGDLIHKIHPLAGQGFNMTLRDIKLLSDLILYKINSGLDLDSTICKDFEKKIKHKNFIFSNGIDLIYEFFNLESKFNNSILTKSVNLLGKNNSINNFFTKLADKGIVT